MNLVRIVITELQEEQVIILREHNGSRFLPILIGINEALAIQRYVNNKQYPRPLTHDLLGNIIQDLGYRVEKIVVTDLQNGVFYAKVVLLNTSKSVEIDARPSDAVALATRFNAPIFADEKVLQKTTDLDQEIDQNFQTPDDQDDDDDGGGGSGFV
ncbi:MAG: bifunctional nuclease family protein [Planctomycetes bacterium]|nr:bifunctional nuclease family protein [Planctomycetota bacterium]